MADQSAIGWTDATWTVVTGCDVVSPACAHCYAREFAPRLQKMELARAAKLAAEGKPAPVLKYQTDSDRPSSGVGFEVVCHEHLLDWPVRLKRGRRIFVTSMGDLFHERVPDGFIASVFATMAQTPQHTYQVLSKRPERMANLLCDREIEFVAMVDDAREKGWPGCGDFNWPLPNVQLGCTVENATWAGRRLDDLKACPAYVRFLSCEPLLGDVGAAVDLDGIGWVIGGGESGQHLSTHPHRFLVDQAGAPRADREQWARSLRDACAAAGVPFFWKQWGGRTPKAGGREIDGREWSEFPVPRVPVARP